MDFAEGEKQDNERHSDEEKDDKIMAPCKQGGGEYFKR